MLIRTGAEDLDRTLMDHYYLQDEHRPVFQKQIIWTEQRQDKADYIVLARLTLPLDELLELVTGTQLETSSMRCSYAGQSEDGRPLVCSAV